MSYQVRDGVVLIIPHWFSLALSIFVFVLTLASAVFNRLVSRGWEKLADRCAEATESYARSDDALVPVLEALGQPFQAAEAKARAAQNRELAQTLRERNRRPGWKGRFLAPRGAQEASAGPGEGDGRTEASRGPEGDLRPVSERER